MKSRGIEWRYYRDSPSFRLIEEQPDHGCDMCSRFRRRAVYQIARELGCNVISFGHTADDFCESFLRSAMFTGRTSSLPAITWSEPEGLSIDPAAGVRDRGHHRETLRQSLGAPVISCGCSQKTGTVRRSLRDVLADLERDYPRLKESLLSAMGNIEHSRMLDTRYLSLEGDDEELVAAGSNPFRVLSGEL